MKFLILLILSTLPVLADVCICQYPKEDARFGEGVRGEIGSYKMGCALWLIKEKDCRREKIMSINRPLEPFLSRVLRNTEKVRVGYVGHWSSSEEMVGYLKSDIEPLRQKFQVPFVITNTACLAMENAHIVQDYVKTIPSSDKAYLAVEGTQTTSIGVWDEVIPHKRKADLIASVDSRQLAPVYPHCKEFLRKGCTAFQEAEKGFCSEDDGSLSSLICYREIKEKANGEYKLRKVRKWLYLNDVRNVVGRIVD